MGCLDVFAMNIHAFDIKLDFFYVGRRAKIDLFSCHLRALKKLRHFDD